MSSSNVLDLNGIKNLFRKGLNYSKDNFSSFFYSTNENLCDYQLSLVDSAQDLTTLMRAVSLPNPLIDNFYKSPDSICTGCELENTGIHFGVGNTEWYFVYGIYQNYCVNITFIKSEIAPPQVVDIDPSEAVRWSIGGGFGIVNGPWYTIPNEYIYMKYSKDNFSSFTLTGSGNNIKNAILKTSNMNFNIVLDFIDTTNTPHSIQLSLTANTPPNANFPGSCMDCFGGFGSLYYSYTDMNMIISNVDNKTLPLSNETSNGWIDHQLMKGGIGNSSYYQSLITVAKVLSNSVTIGWLWFSVQDHDSGLQYMFIHFFKNKNYKDDIRLNKNIPIDVINVYKNGIPYFSPTIPSMNSQDVVVKLIETVTVNGLDLPYKYQITLPGGKQVILKNASSPNVYDSPYSNYENPAYLYNVQGKQIGTGLIEANYYLTNQQIATAIVKASGGNPDDQSQVNIVLSGMDPSQTPSQKFLAFIYILIPLWILLALALFIFYSKQNRSKRATISIVIILLVFFISAL